MSHFEDLSVPIWKAAGKPMTIDEFIEDQRQHVNVINLSWRQSDFRWLQSVRTPRLSPARNLIAITYQW